VSEASRAYYERNMAVLRLSYFYRPGMELLAGLAFAATFLLGGYWIVAGPPLWFSGELTVGEFVVFILLIRRLVEPLAAVSDIVDWAQNARASAERVFGLMDTPVHVTDAPGAVALDGVRGRVEYDDVTFAYGATGPGGRASDDPSDSLHGTDGGDAARGATGRATDDGRQDEPVLRDVSFVAEPGETVALVGPTGAGKSTVAKLLLRLYDPTGGTVRVDGHDLRDVTRESLRDAVGYVSQETFLFDGTVAENVRYGRFDASRDEVEAATRAAQAHEFVREMPDGYDTHVGERGVKLSGGQRQRLAIARLVLKGPDVVVLDEATASVDTATEFRIQRSLADLTADVTTLVIAHRLSTVKDADRILVVEDGRIVERGDHETLLARDGLYADLWRVQSGEMDGLDDWRD
jgi:ATP-binding cassette subfamily B protein